MTTTVIAGYVLGRKQSFLGAFASVVIILRLVEGI